MKLFSRGFFWGFIALFALVGQARADDYSKTIELFKNAGESADFFKKSYAYAVFPTIGKAGLGIGGAGGSGRVYEKGNYVGDVSMSQMKRLFGEQKVNEWCDCAYSTMSAKYSNLDLANAPDAGDLDERATAIKREIYLATAQCMDKSSVPARGSAIKTDFASLLRATVKMDKAWTQ